MQAGNTISKRQSAALMEYSSNAISLALFLVSEHDIAFP